MAVKEPAKLSKQTTVWKLRPVSVTRATMVQIVQMKSVRRVALVGAPVRSHEACASVMPGSMALRVTLSARASIRLVWMVVVRTALDTVHVLIMNASVRLAGSTVTSVHAKCVAAQAPINSTTALDTGFATWPTASAHARKVTLEITVPLPLHALMLVPSTELVWATSVFAMPVGLRTILLSTIVLEMSWVA